MSFQSLLLPFKLPDLRLQLGIVGFQGCILRSSGDELIVSLSELLGQVGVVAREYGQGADVIRQ